MASHVMPDPVEPAPGAEVVEFPWSEASSAVAELDSAATELDNQGLSRASLYPSLDEWEGQYRDDFDETYDSLMSTASGIVETLNSVAAAIVTGAEDAAADQFTANNLAAERAEEAAALQAMAATETTEPASGLGRYT
jgi:uncharacterized protein YukE